MRNVVDLARICHEANRAYCLALGDTSQPHWEDAPEWQIKSTCNGVNVHLAGNLSPKESHEHWLKEKLDQGWVYGNTKDPEKKIHPCCIPYDQLPIQQKLKDSLFKAIIDVFK